MIKRMLVPIDGGDLAPRTIEASIALAKQLGAAIVGFVAEPPVPLPSPGVHATPQGAVASIPGNLKKSEKNWGGLESSKASHARIPEFKSKAPVSN